MSESGKDYEKPAFDVKSPAWLSAETWLASYLTWPTVVVAWLLRLASVLFVFERLPRPIGVYSESVVPPGAPLYFAYSSCD